MVSFGRQEKRRFHSQKYVHTFSYNMRGDAQLKSECTQAEDNNGTSSEYTTTSAHQRQLKKSIRKWKKEKKRYHIEKCGIFYRWIALKGFHTKWTWSMRRCTVMQWRAFVLPVNFPESNGPFCVYAQIIMGIGFWASGNQLNRMPIRRQFMQINVVLFPFYRQKCQNQINLSSLHWIHSSASACGMTWRWKGGRFRSNNNNNVDKRQSIATT